MRRSLCTPQMRQNVWWVGTQGNSDGSSVRNIFECSVTEEVTGAGKSIFGRGFNFSSSEAKKKFDRTASEDRGEIGKQ